MRTADSSPSSRLKLVAGMVILTVLLLLPWWRNHDHIRDLFDYGLVIAANGRIADGERPYVDFLTPIQSGFLAINAGVEMLFGATYLGLTRGGLINLLGGFAVAGFLLARRWPPALALITAWAVSMGSVGQHTIIWHNSLGVWCLAMVLWIVAINPVLSRAGWRWLLLLSVVLVVSGTNKLSYHLVALTGAGLLALRALILQQATGGELAKTVMGLVLMGGVAPLAFELIWTGASLEQWSYNVIGMAAGHRAQFLGAWDQWAVYLAPLHEYYGDLWLPQVGLFSLILAVWVLFWGWAERAWLDRLMLLVAVAGIPGVTMALVLTNLEIVYVAAAAGVAVAAAVILGFEINPSSRLGRGGWWVLTIGFGFASGMDAWTGKRALYGHSTAARNEFRTLAADQTTYAYLAGVKLPPELAESYDQLPSALPAPRADGLLPVFYGAGVEWLERIWPAIKVDRLPLWLHEGTSYGDAESRRLAELITAPSPFAALVTTYKRDVWPDPTYIAVDLFTQPIPVGPSLQVHRTLAGLNTDHDDLSLANMLGTNYRPSLLRFGKGLSFEPAVAGNILFGRNAPGKGTFFFDGVVNRMAGNYVMRRSRGVASGPTVSVEYEVHYEAGGLWHLITAESVTLPADQARLVVPYEFDGRQRPLRFTVTLPEDTDGSLLAGWHAPTMHNSIPDDKPPPPLFAESAAESTFEASWLPKFIRADWQPEAVFARGAELTEVGLELAAGDQLWLRADRPLKSMDGIVEVAPDAEGHMPFLVVLWYQGGRMVVADQFEISRNDRARHFHAWSPGTKGWFGFIVSPTPGAAPLTLRIDQVVMDNYE